MARRRVPATVQATRDRWAVITLAEAIVKAEWARIQRDRFADEVRGGLS